MKERTQDDPVSSLNFPKKPKKLTTRRTLVQNGGEKVETHNNLIHNFIFPNGKMFVAHDEQMEGFERFGEEFMLKEDFRRDLTKVFTSEPVSEDEEDKTILLNSPVSLRKIRSSTRMLSLTENSERTPSAPTEISSLCISPSETFREKQNQRIAKEGGNCLLIFPEKEVSRINRMTSDCPGFELFRHILYYKFHISSFFYRIVTHSIFETLSIFLILMNTIFMGFEQSSSSIQISNSEGFLSIDEGAVETFFVVAYTVEMMMKIVGMGFLFNSNAYLRSGWNVLDFVIIVSSLFLEMVPNIESLNISALRTLRVLRPLRTISNIQSLKNILATIASSLPYLLDIAIVISFFFLIMAIAGLQLFSGVLKHRCMRTETGVLNEGLCGGYSSCSDDWICVHGFENPEFYSNFDDIFNSLLMVFRTVSASFVFLEFHKDSRE